MEGVQRTVLQADFLTAGPKVGTGLARERSWEGAVSLCACLGWGAGSGAGGLGRGQIRQERQAACKPSQRG